MEEQRSKCECHECTQARYRMSSPFGWQTNIGTVTVPFTTGTTTVPNLPQSTFTMGGNQ